MKDLAFILKYFPLLLILFGVINIFCDFNFMYFYEGKIIPNTIVINKFEKIGTSDNMSYKFISFDFSYVNKNNKIVNVKSNKGEGWTICSKNCCGPHIDRNSKNPTLNVEYTYTESEYKNGIAEYSNNSSYLIQKFKEGYIYKKYWFLTNIFLIIFGLAIIVIITLSNTEHDKCYICPLYGITCSMESKDIAFLFNKKCLFLGYTQQDIDNYYNYITKETSYYYTGDLDYKKLNIKDFIKWYKNKIKS